MTDPREAKLPVWVRTELATLRRRVQNAELELNETRLDTDPANSDTVLDAYSAIPVGLGKGTSVRFRLGNERHSQWADCKVKRDHNGMNPYLQIMAGTGVTVEPWSSNVIHLRVTS